MDQPHRIIPAALFLLALSFVTARAQEPAGAGEPQVLQIPDDLQPTAAETFRQATGAQQRKEYGRAIQLYTDLLHFHPGTPETEETLHRMAECYRALGRADDSLKALRLCRGKFPEGEWLAPGHLLEGELLAAEGQWKDALPHLTAAAKSPTPAIAGRAHYLAALGFETTGQLHTARPHLEALLSETFKDNPHRDYARLKLATLLAENGQREEASALLTEAVATASDSALRAEAAVRAGNLAHLGQQHKKAVEFYDIVRRTKAPGHWKRLAHLGLIQAHFALGQHAEVIDVFNKHRDALPDAARAQILFLVAESHRLLNHSPQAIALYDVILRDFPDHSTAEPSAWARLLLLQEDESFIDQTAAFLARFPESERVPLVRLMRADAFYNAKRYDSCLPMYAGLSTDEAIGKLPAATRAALFFRWGRAAFLEKQYATAATALESLLKQFPKETSLAPDALWMAAQARQANGDTAIARKLLGTLIKLYPQYPHREAALWKAALLAGGADDFAAMRGLLETLLREFPETPHEAEACYWMAHCMTQAKLDFLAHTYWQRARDLDPDAYTLPATRELVRIALANRNADILAVEAARYDAWRKLHPETPPLEPSVFEWLAQEFAASKKPARAEVYYRRVLAATQEREQRKRSQLGLSRLLSKLGNWGGAIREWNAYRLNFTEDTDKNDVLEPLTRAHIGAAHFDKARELAEQILKQNPEGEWNARGRILLGEIASAMGRHAEAAKIYSAVALLIDHPRWTPLARERADRERKLASP